jgi:hypothetical protein
MRHTTTLQSPEQDENVLQRLARLTRIARQQGFEIRGEPLGGNGCTWCEIRGRRVLFLDLAQPAAEQAIAIREILAETATLRPHAPTPSPTPNAVTKMARVA